MYVEWKDYPVAFNNSRVVAPSYIVIKKGCQCEDKWQRRCDLPPKSKSHKMLSSWLVVLTGSFDVTVMFGDK